MIYSEEVLRHELRKIVYCLSISKFIDKEIKENIVEGIILLAEKHKDNSHREANCRCANHNQFRSNDYNLKKIDVQRIIDTIEANSLIAPDKDSLITILKREVLK